MKEIKGNRTVSIFLSFIVVLCSTDLFSCKDVAPGISENLYCESCIATVKELVKMLNKKTSDPKDLVITEAMENICKPYNFVEYQYSPPKTVKACELLLERHEEEIEAALAKIPKGIEKHICHDMSKACVNVDKSKKDKELEEVDVSINGDSKKSEVVYEMDPKTGKAKKSKDENNQKEPKTLSKKDKKSSKAKKVKDKKVDGKKKDSVDFLQLDLNDPDSMNKVMAQIKQATQEHTNDFYRKKEEEETRKEEEQAREQEGGKDEL